MAPEETTTVRVPVTLRNEIAEIAEERGTTMVDVVIDAIHHLRREGWWESVHRVLGEMTDEHVAAYQSETKGLDGAASDGLRAG